jgi:hypothetical protein
MDKVEMREEQLNELENLKYIRELKSLGLDLNSTKEEIKNAEDKENNEIILLLQLKRDKIRFAKRMAYEELLKELPDTETKASLLEKDDKYVEIVLKQFGITITFGKHIII